MRFHRRHALLQAWADIPAAHERVRAANLAVARFEPSMLYVRGSGFLDLIFSDGTGIAVIPGIEVVVEMLQERERTPLIWPQAYERLGESVLGELEATLLPWLESLTLARQLNSESVRRFSHALPETEFELARTARFLGASPYADMLPALAPYVYAMRFAGTDVAVCDPYGATGAAVLASRSARVRAHLGGPAQNAFAARWFDREIFGETESRPYDIAAGDAAAMPGAPVQVLLDGAPVPARAVRVATPSPADVMLSFDDEDGSPAREFGIVAPEPQLREPPVYAITAPAGGSSGKILLLMREDFLRAPNADTDEAHALAGRLRAEGFETGIVAPSMLGDDSNGDLVHAFGTDASVVAALARFKSRGIPSVLTPYVTGFRNESAWGAAISRALFTNLRDEGSLEEQLSLFERRVLRIDTNQAGSGEPPYAGAHVILAQSGVEEAWVREAGGAGTHVVRVDGHLGAAALPPAPVGTVAGTKPFIFVHGPIDWSSNLLLLARASARVGMALVVAGPAVEQDVAVALRAVAPERFIHIDSPGEEHLESLYRSARVYADVSWRSFGAHRVRRAAASGCALLLSQTGGGAGFDCADGHVDAASEASLEAGLLRCLQREANGRPATPADAFAGTVAAYAAAQQLSAAP